MAGKAEALSELSGGSIVIKMLGENPEPLAARLVGFLMPKHIYEWFLFDYKKGLPDRISKSFKTKAGAEKAREKYPVKERVRHRRRYQSDSNQ